MSYSDDNSRVVVGNRGLPPGGDAVGSVDENHGDDGDVPLRLDRLVVVGQVVEDGVVLRVEDQSCQWTQARTDVASRRCILAAGESGAKLKKQKTKTSLMLKG